MVKSRRWLPWQKPDIAVITNCYAEHLEGLTDLAGVRRENTSVLESMDANSVLVVYGDGP